MRHQAAQDRERKVNIRLLQIITQCAEGYKPLPTHEQISMTLKVKIHNIARGIRVLIREGKITRTGTRSKYTYQVNSINKTTAPCSRAPVMKSQKPKPELRKPSDPPRLKWLDRADAALKKIDDNWAPVKERFDVLRDKQTRLDNPQQGPDQCGNKGPKEADTLKTRIQCDRECDGLQEDLDGERVEEGDIDNPSIYDDVSALQQYAQDAGAGWSARK